jgi:23S rRNA (adenine2503-C2)-methyltransferase
MGDDGKSRAGRKAKGKAGQAARYSPAALTIGPLQAVLPADLALAAGIDLSDARRIVSLVHRLGPLPERSPATIRRRALDAVRALGHVPALELLERRASAVDPFVKYAFRLADGAVIEAVRIPLERAGRYSICVSSQVGCALGCAFCATGRMGLVRNLEVWEIIEQVRAARADLPVDDGAAPGEPGSAPTHAPPRARVHGVLFQGMGEPLANVDRVIHAIRVLSEPSAQAIDMRNITVCTAGLPAGIERLWREVPAVRLGVSLGAVLPGRRRSLMPIDAAHPLSEVLAAAGVHARATGLSPMLAYTLLEGQNDGDADAAALAELCTRFRADHGVGARLSLIPWNPVEGAGFERSARLEAFRAVLGARGVGAIVRYSGGGDVGAACGQLARPAEGKGARLARPEARG